MSAVILCGTIFYKQTLALPQTQHSKSYKPSYDLGGVFDLTDTNGTTITQEELKNHFSLIYFGYSYCPDICPMGLSCITEVLELLKNDKDHVKAYFITIDPKRDTVKSLNVYKENFHPLLTMLTGTEEQIDKAVKAYKVYRQVSKDKSTTDYLLDHSSLIYVLDRQANVIQVFSHNQNPNDIFDFLKRQLAKKES